eukprot:812195_1
MTLCSTILHMTALACWIPTHSETVPVGDWPSETSFTKLRAGRRAPGNAKPADAPYRCQHYRNRTVSQMSSKWGKTGELRFGGIDAWKNRYKSEASPLGDLPLKIPPIFLYSENGQYTSICDSQSKQRVYDDFKSTRSLQSRSSHQAEPQSSVASGKVPGLPRTTIPAPKSSVRYGQFPSKSLLVLPQSESASQSGSSDVEISTGSSKESEFGFSDEFATWDEWVPIAETHRFARQGTNTDVPHKSTKRANTSYSGSDR